MKHSIRLKLIIDLSMLILMFASMAYVLIGEEIHEWIGVVLVLLFIGHNIINHKWYMSIFRGKYTAIRIFQTIINIMMVLSIIGLMTSGIILSGYVFKFPTIPRITSFARILHMLSAYWGFTFISLHLGLHFRSIIVKIKKVIWTNKHNKSIEYILRIMAMLIAAYGIHALIKNDILSYMFLQKQFVFFNMEQPKILFFIDYIAIMEMWIWITCHIRVFLGKAIYIRK